VRLLLSLSVCVSSHACLSLSLCPCDRCTVDDKYPVSLRQQDLDPFVQRLDRNLLQLTPAFSQAGATVRAWHAHADGGTLWAGMHMRVDV
jgi:hypothetical protein